MSLRVGLCSVTFRSLTPDDVLAAAVSAGVEGIEWGADVHVPPGDAEAATALARRCGDAGIAIPSYGSYLAAGRSSAAKVAPVLDTAVALGAGNVRVWCPFGSPPGSDEALFGTAAEALAAWSAEARARDLTLSLEFHVDTFTETAASTARLLATAGRPANLFTYWQPVQGHDPVAEAATLAADLSHVHVFHWRDDGERRPLAEGDATWPTLLEAAAVTGGRWAADRYAFLEFVRGDDPDQLRADAATLRGWLA